MESTRSFEAYSSKSSKTISLGLYRAGLPSKSFLLRAWVGIFIFFLVFSLAVTPVTAYANDAHVFIARKAVQLLYDTQGLNATKYKVGDYLKELEEGSWYADHTGLYCEWSLAGETLGDDYCDLIHHYGNLDPIRTELDLEVAHPGRLPAPLYIQELYDISVKFWPAEHERREVPISILPRVYAGYATTAGSNTEDMGYTDVGGYPLCEKEKQILVTFAYDEQTGQFFVPKPFEGPCPQWPKWVEKGPTPDIAMQNKSSAMVYLGWQMHLLEDMLMPYHALNLATRSHRPDEEGNENMVNFGYYDHLPVKPGGSFKYDPRCSEGGPFEVSPYYFDYENMKRWGPGYFALMAQSISQKNHQKGKIAQYCPQLPWPKVEEYEADVDTAIKMAAGYIEMYFSDINQMETEIHKSSPVVESDFSFSADPTSGLAPLTVTFTSSSPHLCDTVGWNFGDGTSTEGGIQEHTYFNPGTYSVSCSCIDVHGTATGMSKPDLIVVIRPKYSQKESARDQSQNKQIGFLDMILSIPGQIMGALLGAPATGAIDIPAEEYSSSRDVTPTEENLPQILQPEVNDLKPPASLPPSLLRDGAPCDDGNLCTVSDAFSNGQCTGTPIFCSDGDDATRDACDQATGQCVFTPFTGVVPVESGTVTPDVKKGISTDIPPGLLRDGAPCDDGNLCTVSDTITNGVCNGAAIYCSDGSDLTTDSCDLATGQCVFIPVAKYVLPTTLGVFTPNPTQLKPSGTPKIPLKDGLPCDDGNLCTYNDMWQGGVCTGMPVVCNDGDDSTSDVCNAGTGQCMFIPLKIVGSL